MTSKNSNDALKAKLNRITLKGITYAGLIFFSVISGYPLIWMFFGSLKSKGELYQNIWLWPKQIIFSNYLRAWTHAGIGLATTNSLIVTVTSVVLVILIGSIASYAFAKMRFPGSNLILALLIMTMMIRPVYTSVELFRLTKFLGIIDKYPGLILPNVATSLPLALALFTAYFRSIPNELEDAARIDGANWLTLFFEIVLPLSGPVISAVVIFTFLDAYNELFMALILLKGAGNQTIPVALASIIGQFYKDYPELFAGLSASLAPLILVYLIFQRRFISGMLSGAVKG